MVTLHNYNMFSERCSAVYYCSEACKKTDWDLVYNIDHSHKKWCDKMKCFMAYEPLLQEIPFTFASSIFILCIFILLETTSFSFKYADLEKMLRELDVWCMGLWKYTISDISDGHSSDLVPLPGEELCMYRHLWVITLLDVEQYPPPNWSPRTQFELEYEDSLLQAYVVPSYAIIMSIPPSSMESFECFKDPNLFIIDLHDWSAYYKWRGLCQSLEERSGKSYLSNPMAVLLHWPLTLYHIIAHKLPIINTFTIPNVIRKRTFIVHVIGVENELSLMPVFKELDYLFRSDLKISFYFIGNYIHYSVNKSIFHLSARLSVTVWKGLYHEFVDSRLMSGEKPDVIVGFNVGLVAYGTWPQTLKVLAQMDVPVFFTDSCLYSTIWGFRVIGSLGLGPSEQLMLLDSSDGSGSLAPVLNPFRSPIRIESPGVYWGWFSNAFIFSPFYSGRYLQETNFELPLRLSSMRMLD